MFLEIPKRAEKRSERVTRNEETRRLTEKKKERDRREETLGGRKRKRGEGEGDIEISGHAHSTC